VGLANELLAGKTVEALQQTIDRNLRPSSFEVPGVTIAMKKVLMNRSIVEARNVLGMLEGSDPVLKNEVVVISAHYEHLGRREGKIFRGADDNASGTVGLMELAEAYATGKVKPKRSLLFLAFDAEEWGLIGAFHYADHPVVPLERTVAVLNMDMIGRDEDTPAWNTTAEQNRNSVNIVGTRYNPELRLLIEKNNTTIGLKLDYKTDNEDRQGWLTRSDHFVFAIKSVPMVLFNTGEHPDYHTENDTWDRINYPKMEKIVRLVFLTSMELANSNLRLKFTAE
jgi:Zn-dependent M28 family amino/carboxypeptidase